MIVRVCKPLGVYDAIDISTPFCHNILCGHTDRPTYGINDRSIPRALTLCYIDRQRRAKNGKEVMRKVIWEEPRRKSPLLTMRRPNSPPKLLLPLRRSQLHLKHPSIDRPYSPSQTASGPTQPFCHNTLRTERRRERQTDRHVPSHKPLTLAR